MGQMPLRRDGHVIRAAHLGAGLMAGRIIHGLGLGQWPET